MGPRPRGRAGARAAGPGGAAPGPGPHGPGPLDPKCEKMRNKYENNANFNVLSHFHIIFTIIIHFVSHFPVFILNIALHTAANL